MEPYTIQIATHATEVTGGWHWVQIGFTGGIALLGIAGVALCLGVLGMEIWHKIRPFSSKYH